MVIEFADGETLVEFSDLGEAAPHIPAVWASLGRFARRNFKSRLDRAAFKLLNPSEATNVRDQISVVLNPSQLETVATLSEIAVVNALSPEESWTHSEFAHKLRSTQQLVNSQGR